MGSKVETKPDSKPSPKISSGKKDRKQSVPDSQSTRMSTRQSSSRMMAGTRGRIPQQQTSAVHAPIVENSCGKCFKRIDSDPMTVCSECHQEFHKACLTRMVNSRPVKDWKCLQCLINDVHEADFFFTDNDQQRTLKTFREMANEFKAKHFGVPNIKVSKRIFL